MDIESILKSVAAAAHGAVDKAKTPGGKKPPWLDEEEMGKQKGKVKSIAERLLSIGNKMAEAGKPPDAATVRTLRGIMNELGAAIDRYPSPKAMKSVDMTLEEFQKHAEAEVGKSVEDGDTERAELLASNVESVGKQVEFFPRTETLKISVFADAGQQKTTETERPLAGMTSGPDSGVLGAFAKTVEQFTAAVDKLKAKKPDEKPDEKYPNGKQDDGDGDGKTQKAKKPEDEKDKGKTEKQTTCPKCGAEVPAGAEKCPKCGATIKSDTAKSDDEVVWPLDMNKGRELSDAEAWGKVKKGDQSHRDFGPDPKECRG